MRKDGIKIEDFVKSLFPIHRLPGKLIEKLYIIQEAYSWQVYSIGIVTLMAHMSINLGKYCRGTRSACTCPAHS